MVFVEYRRRDGYSELFAGESEAAVALDLVAQIGEKRHLFAEKPRLLSKEEVRAAGFSDIMIHRAMDCVGSNRQSTFYLGLSQAA